MLRVDKFILGFVRSLKKCEKLPRKRTKKYIVVMCNDCGWIAGIEYLDIFCPDCGNKELLYDICTVEEIEEEIEDYGC